MVEHRTENSGVGGSNPFIGSIKIFFFNNLIKLYYQSNFFLYILFSKFYNYSIYKFKFFKFFKNFFIISNLKPLFYLPLDFSLIKKPIVPISLYRQPKFYFWWFFFFNKINNKKTKLEPITTRLWFFLYLQLYLWSFIKYKFNWFFINFNKTVNNSNFTVWWYQVNSKRIFRKFLLKNKRFYYNLLNLIFFKKLHRLTPIISELISLTPLKKHKKFFYQVKHFLNTLLKVFKKYKLFLGYTIFFKGKLGRKGSVKKSIFFYKFGLTSLTNKSLKFNYKKYLIHTETGIVGCGIGLFF